MAPPTPAESWDEVSVDISRLRDIWRRIGTAPVVFLGLREDYGGDYVGLWMEMYEEGDMGDKSVFEARNADMHRDASFWRPMFEPGAATSQVSLVGSDKTGSDASVGFLGSSSESLDMDSLRSLESSRYSLRCSQSRSSLRSGGRSAARSRTSLASSGDDFALEESSSRSENTSAGAYSNRFRVANDRSSTDSHTRRAGAAAPQPPRIPLDGLALPTGWLLSFLKTERYTPRRGRRHRFLPLRRRVRVDDFATYIKALVRAVASRLAEHPLAGASWTVAPAVVVVRYYGPDQPHFRSLCFRPGRRRHCGVDILEVNARDVQQWVRRQRGRGRDVADDDDARIDSVKGLIWMRNEPTADYGLLLDLKFAVRDTYDGRGLTDERLSDPGYAAFAQVVLLHRMARFLFDGVEIPSLTREAGRRVRADGAQEN